MKKYLIISALVSIFTIASILAFIYREQVRDYSQNTYKSLYNKIYPTKKIETTDISNLEKNEYTYLLDIRTPTGWQYNNFDGEAQLYKDNDNYVQIYAIPYTTNEETSEKVLNTKILNESKGLIEASGEELKIILNSDQKAPTISTIEIIKTDEERINDENIFPLQRVKEGKFVFSGTRFLKNFTLLEYLKEGSDSEFIWILQNESIVAQVYGNLKDPIDKNNIETILDNSVKKQAN
jgi:hypothetical protein